MLSVEILGKGQETGKTIKIFKISKFSDFAFNNGYLNGKFREIL